MSSSNHNHTYSVVKNDSEKSFDMLSSSGIILWHDYVPGKRGYHDLLVSNQDMKRLLDEHGHRIKVVDYNDFVHSCPCGYYHW